MSEARVKTSMTGLSAGTLAFYRHIRRLGFNRHDANMVILGVVSATGEGELDISWPRRLEATHD